MMTETEVWTWTAARAEADAAEFVRQDNSRLPDAFELEELELAALLDASHEGALDDFSCASYRAALYREFDRLWQEMEDRAANKAEQDAQDRYDDAIQARYEREQY